jgi:hypothetical protein
MNRSVGDDDGEPMKTKLYIEPLEGETAKATMARVALTPEFQSASALVSCKNLAGTPIEDLAAELQKQTAILKQGDMTRAEDMLLAQAHALSGIFSCLMSKAMAAENADNFELYMRMSFRAQNQCRATLQTLGELKAPRQVAFVQQANFGSNVQVNNDATPTRARKNENTQNELLEVKHGERLDTRKAGAAGKVDSAVEAVEQEYRPWDCWR